MPRLTSFNSPLLLGFEDLERVLDRVAKSSSEGYPPYNIEQVDADSLRITVAVAGFERQDLSVTLEDNQLVIRGRRSDDDGDRTFIHRGIATRQFHRSFVLAEGIEITGAKLANGLLNIDLVRPRPNEIVKTIQIEDGEAQPSGREAETRPAPKIAIASGSESGQR
jgi:HSP20 family molecular chaperone IbpA